MVTRMPELRIQQQPEEEEETFQTKEHFGQVLGVNSNLESSIGSARSSGRSFPRSVRAFFEPRFGYDFGQVRIHTDADADAVSHSLNARAFTTGQDIFFRQAAYNPETFSGRTLLAHELAHVVQQRSEGVSRISRKKGASAKPAGMTIAVKATGNLNPQAISICQ